MTLVFAWIAVTVVLQVWTAVIVPYWFPVETILTVFSTTLSEFLFKFAVEFILVVACFLLGWAVRGCRAWWPIELQCPRCETRLDELGMKITECPGCRLPLK
jgi:hypothetical protein